MRWRWPWQSDTKRAIEIVERHLRQARAEQERLQATIAEVQHRIEGTQ